ncbi:MAG: YggN family protein [Bacteroidales bacterium]|nr:YggN family protein [Bacteroidales bacterium]
MKKLLFAIFMVVSLLTTTACAKSNPQEEAIKRLQNLTEQLSQDTSKYTDADWEKLAQQFEEVSKVIDENNSKFTAEQRTTINNLRAKCIGLFTAKAMMKATEAMGVAAQTFGGLMEGFLSGLGAVNEEAVGKSLTGVFEALGSALEQSASTVEKDFGKMEKSLNEMGDSLEIMGEKLGVTLESIGKSLEAIGQSMDKRFDKKK